MSCIIESSAFAERFDISFHNGDDDYYDYTVQMQLNVDWSRALNWRRTK